MRSDDFECNDDHAAGPCARSGSGSGSERTAATRRTDHDNARRAMGGHHQNPCAERRIFDAARSGRQRFRPVPASS